jgi:hypothetical protein
MAGGARRAVAGRMKRGPRASADAGSHLRGQLRRGPPLRAGWRVARGAATAEAFVPLSFAPGEAYQFDWSHEIVVLGGVTTKVKLAHSGCATAGYRSCGPIRARAERWCSTRISAPPNSSRGPCTRGIYDNLKTAVEAVFIGKDHRFNRRFADVRALSDRAGRLHTGGRLGEGAGREPGRPATSASGCLRRAYGLRAMTS